jgi:hypothetical protein
MKRSVLGLGLALVLFGCSEGSGSSTFGGATDDGSAGALAAGSFGGVCTPVANASVGKQDLGAACGMSYGGRGTALSVRAALVAVRLGDSGELSRSGGRRANDLLDANVAGIVQANVLHGATRSAGIETISDASVADVRIGVAGVTITAAVLQSDGRSSCSASSGASIITDLRVNGLTVQVTSAPNQVVLAGPVRIVLNEQLRSNGSIVVHALHVSAAGLADVAVATSRASVDCPCGGASTPGDGSEIGNGGAGSDPPPPNAGTLPPNTGEPTDNPGGASSSGGSSGSPPGGDVENAGPAASGGGFGALGDACDDANTCSDGHQCEVWSAPAAVR